jgi:hypothetical protein
VARPASCELPWKLLGGSARRRSDRLWLGNRLRGLGSGCALNNTTLPARGRWVHGHDANSSVSGAAAAP